MFVIGNNRNDISVCMFVLSESHQMDKMVSCGTGSYCTVSREAQHNFLILHGSDSSVAVFRRHTRFSEVKGAIRPSRCGGETSSVRRMYVMYMTRRSQSDATAYTGTYSDVELERRYGAREATPTLQRWNFGFNTAYIVCGVCRAGEGRCYAHESALKLEWRRLWHEA